MGLILETIMQIIINGFINGLTLALLSLAFTAVYLPTRVFYIALAGIYAFVPYIAWQCLQFGLNPLVSVVIAILFGVGLSLLCEVLNHGPLQTKNASSGAHLLSSMGICILLSQCAAMFWGNETKVLRSGLDNVVQFAGIVITGSQIYAFVVSVALIALYYLWLESSKSGLLFRAMADNQNEFALNGYSVRLFRLISFAIAGLLTSVSGLLVAYDIGFDSHGGLSAILLAVVAMIIGGQKSFSGPLVGAMLLGLIRSLVVWTFSAQWAEAITFALLAFFLLMRPLGILAPKARLEAVS